MTDSLLIGNVGEISMFRMADHDGEGIGAFSDNSGERALALAASDFVKPSRRRG